ncbi:MAG: hypothetical protein RIQ79_2535, partial [Verrucomicrobiota bacterium]
YQVLESVLLRLTVTTRKDDDSWLVLSQRERNQRGTMMPDRTLVFSKIGPADVVILQSAAATPQPVRMTVPSSLFFQECDMRIGTALASDPVLVALLPGNVSASAKTLGLVSPVREGTDSQDGIRLARISASTMRGARVILWINEATGLVSRVLEVPDSRRSGVIRIVKETVYRYDFSRGGSSADFDVTTAYAGARTGIEASSNFTSLNTLIKLASDAASSGSVAGQSPVSRVPHPPSTSAPPVSSTPSGQPPAAVAAQTVAPENQELTPEQMEAIVIVEGSDSVGTGFITRIRDVDFVATNLHVVGGYDKVRVTTLRGATITVGSVFGAIGRDIAILRIEGATRLPSLTLAEDPLKSTKLGDKVVVVGNRRGGGVATQVSGVVRGIGPDRVEVDAPFQPGNSGSPILHLATGEVIGVASYSQRRKLDDLDVGKKSQGTTSQPSAAVREEQRWFGYRADGVSKWESIDQSKWRAQAKRIADFESDSEAIYYALYGDFKKASQNARVRIIVENFVERYQRMKANHVVALQLTGDMLRDLRSASVNGVKELETGVYYDFFRSSHYWETSITEQLRARADLAGRIVTYESNPAAYLSRLTQ